MMTMLNLRGNKAVSRDDAARRAHFSTNRRFQYRLLAIAEHAHATALLRCALGAWLLLAATATATAQSEFHFQYGRLTNPFANTRAQTHILTFQNALSWKWGDSFFFADFLQDDRNDGFNDKDLYGEWYPTLSFGKLSGKKVGMGPIRDVALIGGINFDADANVLKYLPGVRLSWKLPGFLFLNTDFTAFIDANSGVVKGGAPRTGNSFMVDVNWGLPFKIGSQLFSINGHAEYIGGTIDELGSPVRSWILAQPQLTWDLGAALGEANRLMLGIEYQYWRNKLGANAHDNVAQLLVIWRL